MKVVAVLLLCLVAGTLAVPKSRVRKLKHALSSEAEAKVDALALQTTYGKLGWDIYGDFGAGALTGVKKDKLHELIAYSALDELCSVLSVRCEANWRQSYLKTGVRWNDMPTGNKNDFLNLRHFKTDFDAKGATVVFNSHYGCLQHIHAMAPVLNSRNGLTENVHFTNAEVLLLIEKQMEFWWDKAVEAAYAATPDPSTYSHYIGHILHTFGDSYAPGHTVRGYLRSWGGQMKNSDVIPARFPGTFEGADLTVMSEHCGYIITFQGYGPQHDNEEHSETDHMTDDRANKVKNRPDKAVRYRLVQCSIAANYHVLARFNRCINGQVQKSGCTYTALLKPVVDLHFRLSLPNERAGGSNKYMADPQLDATKYDLIAVVYSDVVNTVHNADADKIYVPKQMQGDKTWTQGTAASIPATTSLCVAMTARTGQLAGTLVPFTEFINLKPDGSDANQHVANGDGYQV